MLVVCISVSLFVGCLDVCDLLCCACWVVAGWWFPGIAEIGGFGFDGIVWLLDVVLS